MMFQLLPFITIDVKSHGWVWYFSKDLPVKIDRRILQEPKLLIKFHQFLL